MLRWSDYSALDDTVTYNVALTERDIALLQSALWLLDTASWDDVLPDDRQAAIDDLIHKVRK